jgi:nicotinamide-nucleotide amidase
VRELVQASIGGCRRPGVRRPVPTGVVVVPGCARPANGAIDHPASLVWTCIGRAVVGYVRPVFDEDVSCAVAAALDGRSVATAESCTAGRIAEALAGVAGAAGFLRGGVVAYQEEVKRRLLDVTATSVFSTDAAVEMAFGACRLLGSDVAVATTGVAGGEPVDGVPAGTVFVATVVDGAVRALEHRFDGTPEQVCAAARRRALLDLLDHLGAVRRVSGSAATSVRA